MTSSTRDNRRSFSSPDDTGKKKTTKREVFQAQMAAVVRWTALEAMIDPQYPTMGPQGGRHGARALNKKTGSVRAKVEHVFSVLKCQSGMRFEFSEACRYKDTQSSARLNGAEKYSGNKSCH